MCRGTKSGRVENLVVKHLTLVLFIRLTFPLLFVFDSECPDQPHVRLATMPDIISVIAATMEFPWGNLLETISFDVGEQP